MKIIEIVLFCYLHIVLHEVCHFLFFVIQGVQVNKIYIMPIELVISSKIKCRIRINNGFYGVVIPKLKTINDKLIQSIRKKCVVAIVAPSFLHLTLSFIGGIYFFCSESVFGLWLVIINLFMLLQGFYENNSASGDVIGAMKIGKNYDDFIFYLTFVILNDDEIVLNNYFFLKNELIQLIECGNKENEERINSCLIEISNRINGLMHE